MQSSVKQKKKKKKQSSFHSLPSLDYQSIFIYYMGHAN